jgi:hypothetical protein
LLESTLFADVRPDQGARLEATPFGTLAPLEPLLGQGAGRLLQYLRVLASREPACMMHRAPFVEPGLALLAERDAALRQLIALALKNACYDVRQCSNALQLKAELYSSPIMTSESALLVLNIELAAQCAPEISTLERVRSNARTTRPQFLLICEFGGVKQLTLPGVREPRVAAVLEKPFDLDELERIARTCNDPVRQSRGQFG